MFALLITFFPRAFRERFGDDMRDLFRDQVRAAALTAECSVSGICGGEPYPRCFTP